MKITVQSSKVVKPAYGACSPPTETKSIPLSVFDTVTYNNHVSGIYYFHPPVLPNAEMGLAEAMAVYREWAGRLGTDVNGNRAILLNDAGAWFVEAIADVALSSIDPLEPLPELLSLCPSGNNREELMLVQVTLFTCGSFTVGTTAHHVVADGLGRCSFMLAWGEAARGIAIDPVLLHDRVSVFAPRNPPRVQFEHRGVEFKPRNEVSNIKTSESNGNVAVHTVHFTPEMVSKLKSRASVGAPRPYSSLQCVTAHLWRCITKARGLDRDKLTKVKIAVNGRPRMRNPRVPEDYAGNVVLWAQPTTRAGELLGKPLQCTVELISRAVSRMDDSYFRSFIDFATSEAMEKEGLVPTETLVGCPDIFVSNLKGIPMFDLDFGTGRPFLFTRSHPPWEGYVFIMPPLCNDGSMDVQVTLFSHAMNIFKDCCYSLEAADVE
ncbi:hypothetical protein QOZ80_9AG0688710 [Eleusine coracana subsp. coracana]|nr:hypothetical protein QOZ80_9AG0688710 [Eleusine coracana subsp. coracana]